MNVSVVVPTHERPDSLRLSLSALVSQATANIRYDIHVVQDGGEAVSTKLLEDAARAYPGLVRYYTLSASGGPAGPRNHGIRNATGDIVILLDDDVIPDSDFVQQHWQFHQDHPLEKSVALGQLYMTPEVRRDPMSLFFDFPYHHVGEKRYPGYLFFWSGNVSMRREFMLQDGMFLEDGSLSLLEDMECGYRLAQRGMQLHFHPRARGRHVHTMKREWVARKGFNTGQAQYGLTSKIPDVAIKERFGILSTALPARVFARQLCRRFAFRLLDTPLTAALLRLLGAQGAERTRVSDLYYYLIFRRNMVRGYKTKRRESRMRRDESKGKLQNEART
jgi:GT2 family glycosyltransferase